MVKYLLLLLALPVLSSAQPGGSVHPFQLGAKWHRGFIIKTGRGRAEINPFDASLEVISP